MGRGNVAHLGPERGRTVAAPSDDAGGDGALRFSDNAMGVELSIEDMSEDVSQVVDPSYSALTGRMLFATRA